MDKKTGKVKFYSKEKGYGFIFADDGVDVFFRINFVIGAEPPRQGDFVKFIFAEGKSGRGPSATEIEIFSNNLERDEALVKKRIETERRLKEFPVFNGQPQRDFKIVKRIASIKTEGLFGLKTYRTVDECRRELVRRSKRFGGNSIVNFCWHGIKVRKFGGTRSDEFWAEGEVVVLDIS